MTVMDHNNPIAYKRWSRRSVGTKVWLASDHHWGSDYDSQRAVWKPKHTIRAYPCSFCLDFSWNRPEFDEFGRIIVSLPKHRWPQPGSCSCGIYGAWELDTLMEEDRSFPSAVYGRIRVGGRVIPAEYGCRAEYATVDALYLVERQVDNPDPNREVWSTFQMGDSLWGMRSSSNTGAWTRITIFDQNYTQRPFSYTYKDDIPELAETYDVPLLTLHKTSQGWEEKTERGKNDLRNSDR